MLDVFNDTEENYIFQILELEHDKETPKTTITWASKPGRFYSIEFSNDLKIWSEIEGSIVSGGEKTSFLSDNEVRNLNIPKGTLLPEEREIINDHIVITLDMLEQLPYPKQLKNVPEYAGGHHEKLDGTRYPKGLTEDQMSVQAKMMAIADIYEALTAADRPYKDGKKLSMAMRIMGFMKNDYHIDKDLFEIFVREGVYKKYAKDHLDKSQFDEVEQKPLLS